MSLLSRAIRKIKKAETPTTKRIKRAIQRVERLEVPAPKAIYGALLTGYQTAVLAKDFAARTFLFQPMFRARCESAGPGFLLYGGFPYLYGDLRIVLGSHCKLSALTSIVSGHVCDEPRLEIGDHTNIGAYVVISVCERITLGRHVRIANGVLLADNPGHPTDAVARRTEPVTRDQVKPITIEDDVWVGSNAIILPGVTIGQGAIVAAGSVVTASVPPFHVVAGNPARVVRVLDAPSKPRRVA